MDDLGLDSVVLWMAPFWVVVDPEGGGDTPAAEVALGFLEVAPKLPADIHIFNWICRSCNYRHILQHIEKQSNAKIGHSNANRVSPMLNVN